MKKILFLIFIFAIAAIDCQAAKKDNSMFYIYIESWDRISVSSPNIAATDQPELYPKIKAEKIIRKNIKLVGESAEVMIGKDLHMNNAELEDKIDEIQKWLISQGMRHIQFKLAISDGIPPMVREYKAERTTNIDSRLKGTVWKGLGNLSSGHTSDIEIDLSENNRFYFNLPDEEIGYEYFGKLTKVALENNEWFIYAMITKEKTQGINMNTGEYINQTKAIDSTFEVIIKGDWLKATPGPEEMIEGTIAFQGTAPEAKWFLDKTGSVALNGIH